MTSLRGYLSDTAYALEVGLRMISEQSFITIILYNRAVEGVGGGSGHPEIAAGQMVFITLGHTVEVAVGTCVVARVRDGAFVAAQPV